jgi:hypothetical protein
MRAKAENMLQQADRLLCESWNERMWSDGEPIDPSPTIDQAVNGGFPWLEIQCARCKTASDVDLAVMKHPPTTFVHDLASRLRCRKCVKAGQRPAATLLQLGWQPRHPRTEAWTMCNLYSITTNRAAISALSLPAIDHDARPPASTRRSEWFRSADGTLADVPRKVRSNIVVSRLRRSLSVA